MLDPSAANRWALALFLVIGVAAASVAEEPEEAPEGPPLIYKWVDENGIAHYTTDRERIPASLRGGLGRLEGEGEESAARGGPTASDRWALEDARRPRDPYAIRFPGDDPLAAYADPQTPDGDTPPVSAGPSVDPELEQRIAALQDEIARDQETLKALLSVAPGAAPDPTAQPLADQPEFREIAQRLPRLQANLRALQRQRGQPEDL